MLKTPKVAVTGAAGWIGREVCAWLKGHCADVRPLDRFRSLKGVGYLDLMAEESDVSWSEAMRGCRAVVHCAGHVHRPIENEEERRLFRAINVDGTRKLLKAASAAGVPRFVFVSTAALYDWSGGCPMAEIGTLRPTTAYGVSKLQAEELVRASELDWRIARLGTVFGAGDRANFFRLAQGLRARRFLLPGDGAARKSVLPALKAAEVLGRLAVDETPQRMVLNVAAPEAPSLSEICRAFSIVCGFRYPSRIPIMVMKTMARIGDVAVVVKPGFPLTSSVLGKLTTPTVLDVSHMRESFPNMTWESFEESLRKAAEYYAGA